MDGGRETYPGRFSRACITKADHAAAGHRSSAPSRFAESRTSTVPPTAATSTQPPLLDAVLLRHTMEGSSNSATRPPTRTTARPLPEFASEYAECPASLREPGKHCSRLSRQPDSGRSMDSIRVQCRLNRRIRLVSAQTAGSSRCGHRPDYCRSCRGIRGSTQELHGIRQPKSLLGDALKVV
jgi:hypothetical protein